MPIELHFICKQGDNHEILGDDIYKSGNWAVSDATAQEAVGGRIYLHEKQSDKSWHGGTILSWEPYPNTNRKIFKYLADGEIGVYCKDNWAQKAAIIRISRPD